MNAITNDLPENPSPILLNKHPKLDTYDEMTLP